MHCSEQSLTNAKTASDITWPMSRILQAQNQTHFVEIKLCRWKSNKYNRELNKSKHIVNIIHNTGHFSLGPKSIGKRKMQNVVTLWMYAHRYNVPSFGYIGLFIYRGLAFFRIINFKNIYISECRSLPLDIFSIEYFICLWQPDKSITLY